MNYLKFALSTPELVNYKYVRLARMIVFSKAGTWKAWEDLWRDSAASATAGQLSWVFTCCLTKGLVGGSAALIWLRSRASSCLKQTRQAGIPPQQMCAWLHCSHSSITSPCHQLATHSKGCFSDHFVLIKCSCHNSGCEDTCKTFLPCQNKAKKLFWKEPKPLKPILKEYWKYMYHLYCWQ